MRERTAVTRSVTLGNRLRAAYGSLLVLLATQQLTAQETAPAPQYAQPENQLFRWAVVMLVLVGIWIILYKVVYPIFLRYYKHDFCKTIFWTLLFLYSATWLVLSSYILLEFGFHYDWMKWIAAFLGVLWLIAGLGLLLRRNPA